VIRQQNEAAFNPTALPWAVIVNGRVIALVSRGCSVSVNLIHSSNDEILNFLSIFSFPTDRRVIRGCAVDLEESLRNNCHNETMCELCHGFDNCNAAVSIGFDWPLYHQSLTDLPFSVSPSIAPFAITAKVNA
jgi:hypothetical protein